jgi:uncharacterized membrane protein YbhN (UPF0104 family)
MLATAIAGVAVIVIAHATGADVIGRAFDHVDPIWVALIAGAELIAYGAYMLAYRAIAGLHGHAPLALPLVARAVVAGFGPFTIGGGFGIDKQVLHAIDEDERSARVRVMALGGLEWAVLAPIACVTAIVMLASDANVMPSLLWPWALAVPAGFTLAIWAAKPERRLPLLGRRRPDWLAQALESVHGVRCMLSHPRRYAGAWIGTLLYWAADIGAFYGGLRMFGLHLDFGRVVIAYGTGYAATRRSLPLGGAGVTEALMTYSLYWVREPLAPALAAVVAYRAFNFLLASLPALIAHGRLEPLLTRAGELRRTQRQEAAPAPAPALAPKAPAPALAPKAPAPALAPRSSSTARQRGS